MQIRLGSYPRGGVVAAKAALTEVVPPTVARVTGLPETPASRYRGAVAPAPAPFRAIPNPSGSEGRVTPRGAIGPAEVAEGRPASGPTPEASSQTVRPPLRLLAAPKETARPAAQAPQALRPSVSALLPVPVAPATLDCRGRDYPEFYREAGEPHPAGQAGNGF